MAQVLWPTMIPLSVLMMEENKKRKRILQILLGLGLSLSLYYSFCLLSFNVTPQIMSYHIQYNTGFPESLAMAAFIVYLVVTIIPLFVSGIKRTHLLGILMFLSCLITAIFFTQYLLSVWCFFAALISGVIYWILKDSKKEFIFRNLSLQRISSAIIPHK
jgi:Na+/melibiose symporter-like transporter